MKQHLQKKDTLLILLAIFLGLSVWLISRSGKVVPHPSYDQQLAAAEQMQRCMDQIVLYKQERGIPLSSADIHETGLLGEEFNGLTTTLGDLEAKRTTANSDMAALMVLMLEEAGVRPKDRIGASFSGSFPAMNIALLCACMELDVEVSAVVSAGSSTYGANTPELSFPEMLALLIEDGYLPECIATVTLGGGSDTGGGMDAEMTAQLELRLQDLGISVWKEPDFQKNLLERQRLFEEQGKIACYVGIGGNLISAGRGEASFPYGVTLPDEQAAKLTEKSGLLEVYHAQGIPVIHILNIKQLVAEYGLPLDPPNLPRPGQSGIYYQVTYPKTPIFLSLGLALFALILYRKRRNA